MASLVSAEGRDECVVWMNQPSHYQTVFFRELAARPGVKLEVIYATEVPARRRALGWREPSEEMFSQTMSVGYWQAVKRAWASRDAVHLVNGVWSVPVFVICSLLLVMGGARVYFHSERPNSATERGIVRHMLKRVWGKLLFLRARGIFVIGRRAGDYYRALGVPAEKIFPFMYFTRGAGLGRLPDDRSRPFTIIYVGQFVARKRVEDLISAFALFTSDLPSAKLRLVGAGPLRESYLKEAEKLKLETKIDIEIIGPLAPEAVRAEIQHSDVLVLPSAFDGWGLTVNEALQAGVPAICSDGCGVAELLEDNPGWGLVYPAGDVAGLADALRQVAGHPERFRPVPSEVEAKIGPVAMADQFLRVVRGPEDLRAESGKLRLES